MPLVECPNCKNKISDTTSKCIHCDTFITVCPECKNVFADNPKICSYCGYEIANITHPVDAKYSSTTQEEAPADARAEINPSSSEQGSQDLHTSLKEYKVYNSEYSFISVLINVLSVIFLIIPLAIILPFFACVFISLIKEVPSFSAAASSIKLIWQFSENIGEALFNFFGIAFSNQDGSFPILSVLTCVISSGINFAVTSGIVSLIKDEIVYAKAQGLNFDRKKTVSRLKAQIDKQNAGVVDFEETHNELSVWYYFLRKYDGMELTSRIISILINFVILLIPLIYSAAYCAIFQITTENVGVYATAIVALIYIARIIVSVKFSKMQDNRKEKVLKNLEKEI